MKKITSDICLAMAILACALTFPMKARAGAEFTIPTCNQGFNLSHNGVQGMDIWGDYLVSLQNYGTCNIYKLNGVNSATKLHTFKLATYDNASATYNHANVASFSNQFYASTDKVPLLYITRCHAYTDEDGMKSVCYVERLDVDNGSSTLVQKICYDDSGYGSNIWVIDRENNYLYSHSNTVGYNKQGNKHLIRKFKIPEVGEGKPDKVWLHDSDALESYSFEDTYSGGMNDVTQGAAIRHGLLYMPCGFDTSTEPSILYVWDLEKRRMDKELDMTGIFEGEFEDCSVNYPGWLVIQANRNHIYFMSLEENAGDWDSLILADGVAYRITDKEQKTAEVAGYVKIGNKLNIPSYVRDGNVYYKVTAIAEKAFENCTALTTLTLPPTLTEIRANAFYNCLALKTIYSKILHPAECACLGLPTNVISRCTMYVPKDSRSEYRATTGWKGASAVVERSVVLDVGFANGNIVLNRGESSNAVGKLGEAVVQAAPDGSYSLGSSKLQSSDNNSASYNGKSAFYVKYDKDDNVGQTLKDQFTIETVFRLDKAASASYNSTSGKWSHANTIKILGSQGGGGFSLMHNTTSRNIDSNGNIKLQGLASEYIYQHVYASDPWGQYNHAYSQYYLHPGRFYHVAVAIDKGAHTETFYVNGVQQAKVTLAGVGDFVYPNCGTSRRSKGMFFILGGDAAGEDNPATAENPNATTFVSFKIHNLALNEEQVKNLYDTDEVKKFTEPNVDERLLDVQFSQGGGFADKSVYATIEKPAGAVITTQANTEQQRYEMVCDATNTNFLKRPYFYDPAFTRGLCDGYSLEFYAKVPAGDRSGIISALSNQQAGGGPGFEISTAGSITFNANVYGFSGGPDYNYSQGGANFGVAGKFEADKYLHYVAVLNANPDEFKTGNTKASIYLNGKLIGTRTLNGNEVTDLPFAGWQWFCIGGDTNASEGGTTCDYPWLGTISIARVWGKALSAAEVADLYSQASQPEATVQFGQNGFAAVCYPFNLVLPDGVTAYAVTDQTETTATLTAIARSGEAIPYGLPVILQGTAGTTVTLSAALPEDAVAMPEVNLLKGNFTAHSVQAGQAYAILDGDTEAQVSMTGATTLAANQAYLPNTEGHEAAAKKFEIDPNAVKAVPALAPNDGKAVYYNLHGQRVTQPARGLYIVNGKKVFVR
ncbi:MAG: leucine-rich repeat protein [Bacteroidaceae bacterium]|nr:leucine-rich repeat protein [Bacteroidaceae bacterium]